MALALIGNLGLLNSQLGRLQLGGPAASMPFSRTLPTDASGNPITPAFIGHVYQNDGVTFRQSLGNLLTRPPLKATLANGGFDAVTLEVATKPANATQGNIVRLTEQGGDGSILYSGIVEDLPDTISPSGTKHQITLVPIGFELDDTQVQLNYTAATDVAQMVRDAAQATQHLTCDQVSVPMATGITGMGDFRNQTVKQVFDTARSIAGSNWFWYVDELFRVWFQPMGSGAVYTIASSRYEERTSSASIQDRKNDVLVIGGVPSGSSAPVQARYTGSSQSSIGVRSLNPPVHVPGITDQTTISNIANTLGAVLDRVWNRVDLKVLSAFGQRIHGSWPGGAMLRYWEPGSFPLFPGVRPITAYVGAGAIGDASSLNFSNLSLQKFLQLWTSLLSGGAKNPDISPDGTKLVFERFPGYIWTVNLDGTGLTALSPTTGAGWFEPRWFPDGSGVICAHDVGGSPDVNEYFKLDYPSGTQHQITQDTSIPWKWRPSVSSDSKTVVCTIGPDAANSGGPNSSIRKFTLPATLGSPMITAANMTTLIPTVSGAPAYDGVLNAAMTLLTYDKSSAIWVANADGSSPANLHAGKISRWGGDGRVYFLYDIGGTGTHTPLWSMKSDGSDARQEVDGNFAESFAISTLQPGGGYTGPYIVQTAELGAGLQQVMAGDIPVTSQTDIDNMVKRWASLQIANAIQYVPASLNQPVAQGATGTVINSLASLGYSAQTPNQNFTSTSWSPASPSIAVTFTLSRQVHCLIHFYVLAKSSGGSGTFGYARLNVLVPVTGPSVILSSPALKFDKGAVGETNAYGHVFSGNATYANIGPGTYTAQLEFSVDSGQTLHLDNAWLEVFQAGT